jgi:uncharacterized damage-inducible protein DinB
MKLFTAAFLFAAMASAQDAPPNPLVAVSKAIYASAKNDILRSAEKVPEEMWSYQPVKEVRTFAQLFAHVADGQYEFCGVVAEGKPVDKGTEKAQKTKAGIVSALKEAFAYCDATYAKMTDADTAAMVNLFGMKLTKLGAMDLNITHTMEHYGNLVTYMRIKGIVPPSSEPSTPAPAPKK